MRYQGTIASPEALGALLQQARLSRGLTQRELATTLGCPQNWIWDLERGKPGIFTERLFAYLAATDARLSIDIPGPESSDG